MARNSFVHAIPIVVATLAMAGCAMLRPPATVTMGEPRFDASRVGNAHWALVLSSGAMRGFAHVGVLRELEAAGLRPDLIVGTSAGAIVGALAASGLNGSELDRAALEIGADMFTDWKVPYTGLIGGGGIHAFIDARARQHRIEDFPIRFAAVSVEAERGCLQIFSAGDAGKAVQASSSMPVVLAPPEVSRKRYLDGGLISPLPVRVARLLGASKVVAIDVTFDPAQRPFLNITDAFWRSSLVMHRTLAVNEGVEADLLITPHLPPESSISPGNRKAIIESGAQAIRDALPALRQLLGAPARSPDENATATLSRLLCRDESAARR